MNRHLHNPRFGRHAFAFSLRAVTVLTIAILIAVVVFNVSDTVAQSPPADPYPVTVTRANSTITATWPAVDGATSYHITYSSDGGTSWSLGAMGHTENSITISDVDNNDTYMVAVRALNSHGSSGWINSVLAGPFVPDPPDAPSSITITRADGTITATWPAVDGATSYHITYSSDGGTSWSLGAFEHTDNSITISDVTNSSTYIVAVRALSSGGNSGWTNSSPSGAYTPPPPSALTAANPTATSVTLTITNWNQSWWYKPAETSGGGTYSCSATVFGTETSVTGLTADTEYTVSAYSDSTCTTVIATSASFETLESATGPTVTAGNIEVASATLTRSGFTGDWYYQADKEPHTGCSDAETGDTINLTGLNSATTYTYNTYGDADCTSLIQPAIFTTTGRTPQITETNATDITIPTEQLSAKRWSYKLRVGAKSAFQSCVDKQDSETTITGLSADTSVSVEFYRWGGCTPADLFFGIALRTPKADLSVNTHSISPTITISNKWNNRKWSYRQESPTPQGSCTNVVAGTNSATLSNLSTGTEYRFDAYEDDSCATSISGGTVTFTIPEFTGVAGATTAVLSINNWDNRWWYRYIGVYDTSDNLVTFSGGPCRGPITDKGVTVTGLTSGYTLGFMAYSNERACKDATQPFDESLNGVLGVPAKVKTGTATLTANALSSGGVRLSISNWTRSQPDWYYRVNVVTPHTAYQLHGPTGCKGPVTGGATQVDIPSADIPALVGAQSYVFTVYPSSGCNYSTVAAYAGLSAALPANPTLTVTNIQDTNATLNITNYPGTWYYKANVLPHSSCQNAVSSATHNLTNLPAGKTYLYKAFSDSACKTVIDDTGYFTTPSLTVDDITKNSATLTLTHHTGNWYVKQTTPSGGSCSSAISDSDYDLSSLSSGTTHTFKAYSDSGCTTVRATVSFTTLGTLSSSNVTATSATVTMSGQSGNWWLKRTTPGDSTCTAKTTNSENLHNLNPDTSFTFKAYSDSGCSDELAESTTFKTAKPLLVVSDQNLSSATFTLSGWDTAPAKDGSWYYKYTSPSGGTCSSAPGTTFTLDTLWVNTDYAFKAYSDSKCTNEIASARSFLADIAENNLSPTDIWSDGTTLFVGWYVWSLEYGGIKAFDLGTGKRDTSKEIEFTIQSENRRPFGVWGDASTLYVSDSEDDKIYAYNRATKARDTSKDFTYPTDIDNPYGIWSDGITMWVSDGTDEKFYAYRLSDWTRDTAKDYDTLAAAGNAGSEGMWSDGTTMWASDFTDGKIYAYNMSDKSHDSSKDYELDTENTRPSGIWSDGTRMYVADVYDDIIYVYGGVHLALTASDITSSTATLTVDKSGVVWFYKANKSPDNTCSSMQTGTTVDLANLTAGESYTYTAYSDSACSNDLGSVTFATRPTSGGRYPAEDFNTINVAGIAQPEGIWSDGTTMWVMPWTGTKIHAFNMATKARDSSKDITIKTGLTNAQGITSDGTTMWLSDYLTTDTLFAHNISSKSYDSTKDITLHADNNWATHLTSDGTTIWVMDNADKKIYAYTASTRTRDTSKELTLHADNSEPTGFWTDGTTMWVADDIDDKIYAYKRSDGSRDPSKDYNDLDVSSLPDSEKIESPKGIWSDGKTMWVSNARANRQKLFAFGLITEGIELSASDITRNAATLSIDDSVGNWYYKADELPHNTCSSVVNEPSISLTGLTSGQSYTYTAYSDNGCTNELGTVSFDTKPSPGARYPAKDIALATTGTAGIWSDGTTLWAQWYIWSLVQGGVQAYDLATGARDSSKDVNMHANGLKGFGLTANASTFWVAVHQSTKVFAYDRSTYSRDTSKEFDLHADNDSPWGIWTDGTTMWVIDSTDDKIYAYQVSDWTRDASKDFDTLDAAGNNIAEAMWSDGTTMWVSDYEDAKVYAYKMSDKSRDPSKDYSTVSDLPDTGTRVTGIWSDGTVMYVAFSQEGKIYAYAVHAP